MRIKGLSNKVIQLEKDIKDVESALELALEHPRWKELAKESDRHIVKVLYKEYIRLTDLYNRVCVTEVYCGPDDEVLPEVLPEVKRFFTDL